MRLSCLTESDVLYYIEKSSCILRSNYSFLQQQQTSCALIFCALAFKVSYLITVASSSGNRNVTVWHPSIRPSVCPVGILTVTHQETARDAASVHFGTTIRSTRYLHNYYWPA